MIRVTVLFVSFYLAGLKADDQYQEDYGCSPETFIGSFMKVFITRWRQSSIAIYC